MALVCQLDCHQTWIQPRSQGGTGYVTKCYVSVTDEFTENPKYWATEVTEYNFENGSYTVTVSIDPGPHNNEGCPGIDVVSTFDPEFDYGASTGDPSVTYEDEVSEPTAANAVAAIEWEDWGDPDEEIIIGREDWHGTPFVITASLSVETGGFTASASATRQQWRQTRGYRLLDIAVHWLDGEAPGSILLLTGGDWSAPVELTVPDQDLTDVLLYVGHYIPA